MSCTLNPLITCCSDDTDGRESHYNPSVESSDDSDDDSSPNQPQPLTPVRPAPKAPQRLPNVQEIPPYVSSRRKPVPVSTTPLKPTSSKGFNRAPIPNKPGWERVEVQRQSGATKGKWDIYFYAPGCKIPLRSRPELRDYCEQALKISYNPDEFNWKPSEPLVDTVSQLTQMHFNIVNLGRVSKLLGVEFDRDDNKLMLHQTQFIDQLAQKYAVVANKLIKVPVTVGTTLTVPKEHEIESEFSYRNLIGSLMFLASRTRPDIMYSVIYLSQFNNAHSLKHIKCLLQVLQYVVNTKSYCLNLLTCKGEDMSVFSDASWATLLWMFAIRFPIIQSHYSLSRCM
uniref:MBD domain-containing protein n=1 Tax=Strigamia maritima TaxID=126957 RepID=T1JKI7_STRMM